MNLFPITLVSNASMKVFPQNKIATFKTLLPDGGLTLPDDGTGRWEVALLDLEYPTQIKNVPIGLVLDYSSETLKKHVKKLILGPGMYRSVDEILEKISKTIKMEYHGTQIRNGPIKWKTQNDDGHLLIKLVSDDAKLLLSDDILAIFGFNPGTILQTDVHTVGNSVLADNDVTYIRSTYPIDIQRLHTILIYTDIIEPSIVGDIRAPLLRTIALPGKINAEGELMRTISTSQKVVFSEPLLYQPLNRTQFHTMEINLNAENGELIPFTGIGRCTLTLLFRYNRSLVM